MELYKKGCFHIFLFPQITQINGLCSKIMLNVHFTRCFLLSEHLYDNILQWESSKYFCYNKILHSIRGKGFLLVLSFMLRSSSAFPFWYKSLLSAESECRTLNFIIWFHILVYRTLGESTRCKTFMSSQHAYVLSMACKPEFGPFIGTVY